MCACQTSLPQQTPLSSLTRARHPLDSRLALVSVSPSLAAMRMKYLAAFQALAAAVCCNWLVVTMITSRFQSWEASTM